MRTRFLRSADTRGPAIPPTPREKSLASPQSARTPQPLRDPHLHRSAHFRDIKGDVRSPANQCSGDTFSELHRHRLRPSFSVGWL
ncbi:hypothetical protein HispidOSU_021174, partial [Sigmodon hispidus]